MHKVQKTVKVHIDKVVDVPVIKHVQVPQVQVLQKTVKSLRSSMLIAFKTFLL